MAKIYVFECMYAMLNCGVLSWVGVLWNGGWFQRPCDAYVSLWLASI